MAGGSLGLLVLVGLAGLTLGVLVGLAVGRWRWSGGAHRLARPLALRQPRTLRRWRR